MLHPAPARRVERHGARASRAHGHGDPGGILLRAVTRATKRICNTTAAARSVVAERSLRIACLVPVADDIGACSDAQRSSRAGEQRSRTRTTFAAPVPFTGSDTGTSGGRQHAEGEASVPRTAGTRRCPARQRPEGWTVNEIPSTPGSLTTVGSRSYGRY